MEQADSLLLNALKAAIHNEKAAFGVLPQETQTELLRRAVRHGVLPLVLDACGKALKAARQMAFCQTAEQILKTQVFLQLYSKLREMKLHPLVLKGPVCAALYPKPELRLFSDVDLLAVSGEFDRTRNALLRLGCRTAGESVDPLEQTFYLPGSPLVLELHGAAFPENDAYGHMNAFFAHEKLRTETVFVQGEEIYTFGANETFLYLLCHSLKHFLHGGCGIRAVCDLLLFAEKHEKELDKLYLRRCCEKQHKYTKHEVRFRKGGRSMAYMRLGDLLIAAGAITQEQLEEALTIQKQKKERLGDVLIESNIITERQLIEALQMQLGVDFIDLTAISIPLEFAKFVPRAIAKKYNVVPVKLVKDELFVAMSDPLNFVAQEEIKAASHKRVVPMISTRRATEQAIGTLYGSEGTARAIEEMKREVGTSTPDIVPVQMNQTDAGNASAAPTIRFVNSVIERAFLERASDIHLEPQEGEMVVRMRIDGILRKILTVPANLQSNVISRLKIMGGMNISERKIPQDGRAMVQVRHHEIDLRISSMPTIYGEKIVLRLLDKSGHTITKQSIGLEGTDLQKYDALLKNSSGVILIVGPTGSGKSTTMCAMLQELANEETNLMTLEDPVEYNIPGVNQCQINEKTGMTFAAGLRAILRQDPDVISVGEIRDGETGAIAIRAAITGHLVLSTLHTNDAVSAIDRLVDIGVEPYLISSALRGVISQRLVRKVCPHCKKAYRPEAEELAMLGLPENANVQFYRGEGCQECYHTGYKGRRAVFEIFVLNGRIRRMVTEGAKYDALLRAATETNFVTMRENCRNLVLRGEISAAEAARAINSTAD
ncbi:ATPase, T2SS/T4P/T4SS family [Hominenteromicrobium sp.]|uniref:ATPase, T2SS/T4P/T4SS family n=1 Tax=Hominenteromicrobium sp. TaxID=3073581 RepID=UPI003AB546BE